MSPAEYKSALHSLGLTQCGAAEFMGVHDVTARRWAAKGPPPPVAKLLRLMVALQFTVDYVERVTSG